MDSCLLCLEINKDILDTIKANSLQWQELNVAKIIGKHFWSLISVYPSSWICLTCWQEVEHFHKFYMRIEEAHMNFGKTKVEDDAELEYKTEVFVQKPKIKDNSEEQVTDGFSYCFLEPEILFEQNQSHDLADSEILIDQSTSNNLSANRVNATSEPLDENNLDDKPLHQTLKRLRLQNDLANEDPLKKCKNSKIPKPKYKKLSKNKTTETEIKSKEETQPERLTIKEEPDDLNDNNNDDLDDSASENDSASSDVSYQPGKVNADTVKSKKRKDFSKHRTSRKENDKFIAEHFKRMFCDLCQAPFENFSAMDKHFNESHQQGGYVVCCKRKFFDRTRLVDHLHSHLNPDHFKCPECAKPMSDRIGLNNHMLRVHRASEIIKQHCCDFCGKSFTKPYFLKIHKLTHLPEEEKKFPCNDCGKNYGTSYLLNQHHQAVHLKRFVKICYICGKGIHSNAEFRTHMNKHEGIPAPVISCDVCGLRLTTERGLKRHKESQHPVGGKQEHHCPVCLKISPTLKALKKHINTMHVKGYDYKCSICEKAFKRSEALKEHMAAHTGTTLYTCPWCPKTFNSNGNMHAHRKKIHPKEWEESKLQKYSGHYNF